MRFTIENNEGGSREAVLRLKIGDRLRLVNRKAGGDVLAELLDVRPEGFVARQIEPEPSPDDGALFAGPWADLCHPLQPEPGTEAVC